jgi:transcriptional regulator with XRE-family HTH domain
MAGKALTPEQNETARAVLRKLSKDFETQDDFARALGIKQSTLSQILSGDKGVGGKVLTGLMSINPDLVAQITGKREAHTSAPTVRIIETTAEPVSVPERRVEYDRTDDREWLAVGLIARGVPDAAAYRIALTMQWSFPDGTSKLEILNSAHERARTEQAERKGKAVGDRPIKAHRSPSGSMTRVELPSGLQSQPPKHR